MSNTNPDQGNESNNTSSPSETQRCSSRCDYNDREVYFAGVPKNLEEWQMINYLSQFGNVISVTFSVRNSSADSTNHRGCGRAMFETENGALEAIKARHVYDNREFEVRRYYSAASRRRMERMALDEKRKAYIEGVPLWYPKGKYLIS